MRFSLVVLPAALGLYPATACAKDEPTPDWITRVQVVQLGYLTNMWDGPWLTSDDMPVDLKNKPFKSSTNLSLALDTQGKPISCAVLKASTDTRLDAIACRKLTQTAKFSPMYEAPARPIAYKVNIGVDWSTVSPATFEEQRRQRHIYPAPAPQPSIEQLSDLRGWPRLKWEGGLQIDRFPDLQSLRPAAAGKSATGTTGLDLIVDPAKGIVDCTIGTNSGNAALDEAACTAAKALPLSYPQPCSTCSKQYFPLQFVWLKKGSHIRVPLPFSRYEQLKPIRRDPADPKQTMVAIPYRTAPPMSLSMKDFANIADKSLPNPHVVFRLSIDRDGKVIGCDMTKSSGNPAVDTRFCALMSRARYGLMTDAFGDPAANKQLRAADLTGLF